jgi:hypothetical protein
LIRNDDRPGGRSQRVGGNQSHRGTDFDVGSRYEADECWMIRPKMKFAGLRLANGCQVGGSAQTHVRWSTVRWAVGTNAPIAPQEQTESRKQKSAAPGEDHRLSVSSHHSFQADALRRRRRRPCVTRASARRRGPSCPPARGRKAGKGNMVKYAKCVPGGCQWKWQLTRQDGGRRNQRKIAVLPLAVT